MALVNRYDNYGTPASTNQGRFQYTGQMWIGELGMYHYKARVYAPTLGRFLQTDPIGYADGMNLYAYVGNDPINRVDPSGLSRLSRNYNAYQPQEPLYNNGELIGGEIEVVGERIYDDSGLANQRGGSIDVNGLTQDSGGGSYTRPNPTAAASAEEIVTALKKVGQCAAAQYGLGDGETPTGLDFGKIVSEVGALPIPKSLVGVPVIGNSSRFTNAVSLIPHKLGIRINTGTQILGSGRVFGVLGRANVIAGGVLLAWDATSIAICTVRE